MKSSIKKKVKESRKENIGTMNDGQESKRLTFINNHLSRSTIGFEKTSDELKNVAARELENIFREFGTENETKNYLIRNWYDNET